MNDQNRISSTYQYNILETNDEIEEKYQLGYF